MSWILYTIAATAFQTFRNLEQKAMNVRLDALTVSWSRYLLPLPFGLIVIGYTSSLVDKWFIIYCLITAFFQVAGNISLLQTFKSKNFSIGIAFYKTETLQAMIIGLLFLSEPISFNGFLAIMVAMLGVMMMSGLVFDGGVKKFIQSLGNKATLYGLLTGFCFSISAFNLKFASETLLPFGYSKIKAAVAVLMWVICFQNAMFIIVKFYQKRLVKDLKSLLMLENKYAFFKTTVFSFLGSVCWFTAYAVGNVVYVKAVGQIEMVMAAVASHFILKERLKKMEALGIVLTTSGILGLIFFH
jgi:drug/metabolite transporter (DMT)-like permease